MGTHRACVVFLVVTLLAILGCGASRPATFWTVGQAESIRLVRGTALETTTCTGLGEQRADAYHRFSCVGVVRPEFDPVLAVRVRYVLNPRGRYSGRRSAYLTKSVRFDSFGVP